MLQVSTDLYQPKSGLKLDQVIGVSGLSNACPDPCIRMRNSMVTNMSTHGYAQIAGTSG